MEKITKLIQTLTGREIRLFHKYAALSGKKKNNLKIRLFNISCENPEISDIEAAKLLGMDQGAAFSMLKSRLYNDLLDLLLLVTDSSSFYNKAFWIRYSMLKSLMLVYALDNRNLANHSNYLISKAEQLALKFDQPTYRVLVNELILNSRPFMKGPATVKKVKETMLLSLDSQADIIKIQNIFKQISSISSYNSNQANTQLAFIELKLQEIEDIYARNPSPRITFFYLRSKLLYALNIQDFNGFLSYAQKLLEHVQSEVSIRSNDNLGGAYTMLSNALMYLKYFNESIEACYNAEKLFFKHSNNDINTKSVRFIAHLYVKDYQSCVELVAQVRSIKRIKRGSFHYSKWLYLDANIKFIQGNYKATLQLLERHSFLKSDRSGWRLGYKILEMMCIVELGNYDWLPYRIDTFRKLVNDIKKENTARPKLMLKLLKRLIKENFDFDTTTAKMQQELSLLQSNTGEYFCDILGYEVIRFDEWWVSKLKAPSETTSPAKRRRKKALKD
ncbi:MAG TPA: hypothetical protein PKL06_08555 [Chitinophagales bacterium]|nr:hypothetical protein [Chitinophagales bacterium]